MKKFLAVLLALAMILACFTACGDKKEEPAAENPSTEAKSYKETVVFTFQSEPSNGSPYFSNGTQSRLVSNQTHEALFNYNYDTQVLDPVLAESCTDVNGDGMLYEVKIRQGVTFHDGKGETIDTLTADDVKFTWEYAGVGGTGSNEFKIAAYAYVDKIEVVDDYTIRFYMKAPTYDFQFYLAGDSKVLSKEAFDKIADSTTAEEVGTGPYYYNYDKKMDGSYHTFTRYENYWGGLDKYPSKNIEWRVIPDSTTQVSALQTGEVDMVISYPISQLSLIDGDANFKSTLVPGTSNIWFTMNWHNSFKPTDETAKKIRQAMCYAIDRESMIKVVYATSNGKAGSESYYFVAPVVSGYKAVTYPYMHDTAKAQEIMTGLGYSADKPLHLKFAFYSAFQSYAEVLQAQLKDAYIDLELCLIDASTSNATYAAGEGFDLLLNYTSLGGAMMYDVDRSHLSTGAAASGIYAYANPEYDELSAAVKNAGSYEAMKEKFVELQEWLVEETPYINLGLMNSCVGMTSKLEGFTPCPRINDLIFNTIYIEE